MQHLGLDQAHNYTAPGLPWKAVLKMSDVELDLFTDMNMRSLIEERTHGGCFSN